MEAILLEKEEQLKEAINFFGEKNSEEIKEKVLEYPCILIGNFSDDVEFGENYTFCIVTEGSFKKESGIVNRF